MPQPFISFPENSLLPGPIKIEILYDCENFFSINKPQNVQAINITNQIRANLTQGQFAALNISCPQMIYALDEEISGVFLIAKTKSSGANLRNIFGSTSMAFEFVALSLPSEFDQNATFTCSLPLAKDLFQQKMRISHKIGKKSCTEFLLKEKYDHCEIWQIKTTFLRTHQVRLHAHESNIKLIGESLYAQNSIDITQSFRKKFTEKTHWSATFLPIHLSKVSFQDYQIISPMPKEFNALIKLLIKI